MHVISRKALAEFWKIHPPAQGPMAAWFKVVQGATLPNFAAVGATFNSADKVDKFTVFNVGGGGYRGGAAIHFHRQKRYIRHVLTHSRCQRWGAELGKSEARAR